MAQSFFISLPSEIRNQVYDHLLVSVPSIRIRFVKEQRKRRPVRMSLRADEREEGTLHVAVIGTCKLIQREASSILYSSNRFSVIKSSWDPKAADMFLLDFMNTIGPQNTAELRFIELHLPTRSNTPLTAPFIKTEQKAVCKLRPDSKRTLRILRDRCPYLSGITVILPLFTSQIVASPPAEDMVKQDRRIKAMKSLQEVRVRLLDEWIPSFRAEAVARAQDRRGYPLLILRTP
ncbi:hypothetical protein GQ53DRAFT_759778 [Thozetella sp. PMI_491]|nr:hypothetical protein GQ53DRAFT_759778 [Thozetella sp. PMI_491]